MTIVDLKVLAYWFDCPHCQTRQTVDCVPCQVICVECGKSSGCHVKIKGLRNNWYSSDDKAIVKGKRM